MARDYAVVYRGRTASSLNLYGAVGRPWGLLQGIYLPWRNSGPCFLGLLDGLVLWFVKPGSLDGYDCIAFEADMINYLGPNHREDVGNMIEQHPLCIDYWDDKKAKLRNITIPMYATASYSTGLHTEGSVKGFQLSRSTEKW